MRPARPWPILFAVGIVLAIVFAPWVFGSEGYDPAIAIAELLSGLLLLQLPAVAWRIAGGSLVQVLALAIVIPLIVAEAWLGISAVENSGRGGDLQGIEYTLMWVVVAPIVVSAMIVALLSSRWIPVDPVAGD
jgi:hypothetical protein